MNEKKTHKNQYFPGQRLRIDAKATGYVDCHHDKVIHRLREVHAKCNQINKDHKIKSLQKDNIRLFNHLTDAKPIISFQEFDEEYKKSKQLLAKRMPGSKFISTILLFFIFNPI